MFSKNGFLFRMTVHHANIPKEKKGSKKKDKEIGTETKILQRDLAAPGFCKRIW